MATPKTKKETVKAEQIDGTNDFFIDALPAVKDFVFMDKTAKVLEIGLATRKNIVLYGPGGHGKSEITESFFAERGITPYTITMGTGMTTDRLFGGLNIPTFNDSGKIEYLVENSFMNHEYVVFEEMFDAPDFILEQLKDILSSGVFRNGTQVFPIQTKFIVCCTNRTRDEFSKNMSLRALMERFPLELNVVWDNYTDHAYNTLLEGRFGQGNVDPVIPFILQEYAKNSIVISPRVAITAYAVFEQCGAEALSFIAEFSKKPQLIIDGLKKFENTAKLHTASAVMTDYLKQLQSCALLSADDISMYNQILVDYNDELSAFNKLKVADDLITVWNTIKDDHGAAYKSHHKKLVIAQSLMTA